MADEFQQAEGQISDGTEGQQTTENATEEVEAGSSPTPQEDWQSKASALEERLNRQEERNRYLEQTARLLEENSRRQYQAPAPQEPSLSAELAELDRTLDPLFSKRMKTVTDPLGQHVATLMDGQDALKFELYLSRNHPELLDDDNQAKVFQQVEQVRQQAANVYGKYLSRVDAFLYAQGLEGVTEKKKARQTKKQTQVKEEAKRQLQVQATQSGVGTPDARRVTGAAGAEQLMARLRRGERLTNDERAKVREYLANAQV
jgi:succinate dehydrogenase flavin-adding protein (antitoxin of CptAB toxin-antitoxin module)